MTTCCITLHSSPHALQVILEAAIAEAIRERTEVHLRKLGATVSSKVRRQRRLVAANAAASGA